MFCLLRYNAGHQHEALCLICFTLEAHSSVRKLESATYYSEMPVDFHSGLHRGRREIFRFKIFPDFSKANNCITALTCLLFVFSGVGIVGARGLLSRPSLVLREMRALVSGDVQNGLATMERFRPQASTV
jgi:hypothetical protein